MLGLTMLSARSDRFPSNLFIKIQTKTIFYCLPLSRIDINIEQYIQHNDHMSAILLMFLFYPLNFYLLPFISSYPHVLFTSQIYLSYQLMKTGVSLCFMLLLALAHSEALQLYSVSSSTTQILPPTGSVSGGTTIYLKGLGFSTTPSENQVFVGPYPCTI